MNRLCRVARAQLVSTSVTKTEMEHACKVCFCFFLWLYDLLQTIDLVDLLGVLGHRERFFSVFCFSFLISMWRSSLWLSERILRMVTDRLPVCVLSLNLHFAWEWRRWKGEQREERREREEREERREERKRKGEGEEKNRREKGKDKEEGCNYGIAHNLGCSKENFKLQLSRVQSQSWAWKLMTWNFSDFLVIWCHWIHLWITCKHILNINVAVLSRNWTLFHCVFRLHYCVRSAVAQNFRYGWGSYVLCKRVKYSWVYTARMMWLPQMW